MQHAASHTTTLQPSSHNQRHILIGKQWYQLPELIPANSNSGFESITLNRVRIKLKNKNAIKEAAKATDEES